MDLVLRRKTNGIWTELVWPDGDRTQGPTYRWLVAMGGPPLRSGQKLTFRLVRRRTTRA